MALRTFSFINNINCTKIDIKSSLDLKPEYLFDEVSERSALSLLIKHIIETNKHDFKFVFTYKIN